MKAHCRGRCWRQPYPLQVLLQPRMYRNAPCGERVIQKQLRATLSKGTALLECGMRAQQGICVITGVENWRNPRRPPQLAPSAMLRRKPSRTFSCHPCLFQAWRLCPFPCRNPSSCSPNHHSRSHHSHHSHRSHHSRNRHNRRTLPCSTMPSSSASCPTGPCPDLHRSSRNLYHNPGPRLHSLCPSCSWPTQGGTQ